MGWTPVTGRWRPSTCGTACSRLRCTGVRTAADRQASWSLDERPSGRGGDAAVQHGDAAVQQGGGAPGRQGGRVDTPCGSWRSRGQLCGRAAVWACGQGASVARPPGEPFHAGLLRGTAAASSAPQQAGGHPAGRPGGGRVGANWEGHWAVLSSPLLHTSGRVSGRSTGRAAGGWAHAGWVVAWCGYRLCLSMSGWRRAVA